MEVSVVKAVVIDHREAGGLVWGEAAHFVDYSHDTALGIVAHKDLRLVDFVLDQVYLGLAAERMVGGLLEVLATVVFL